MRLLRDMARLKRAAGLGGLAAPLPVVSAVPVSQVWKGLSCFLKQFLLMARYSSLSFCVSSGHYMDDREALSQPPQV